MALGGSSPGRSTVDKLLKDYRFMLNQVKSIEDDPLTEPLKTAADHKQGAKDI
jgi:hypothetical protein